MLTDARKVLVNAHKYKKCKVCIVSFQTHQLRSILDKNSLRTNILKFENFLHFLKICKKLNEKSFFVKFFAHFEKMQKMLKFQNVRSQWIFVENTSELVRLKAYDVYFAFLTFMSIYEHFASIYEHLHVLPKWNLSNSNIYGIS